MLTIFRTTFSLAGLVALLALTSPTRAAPADPLSTAGPITLYVATGDANICGLGCNEWIVAEGEFGVGSATQFRALIARLGKQKLPVYFNSPGGLVGEALQIGRMMREKGLTSALGRTAPSGCSEDKKDEKKAKECSALKKTGKKLEADLYFSEGRCNSACVYAVLGGKTRLISPGARLGVHAARSVNITNKQVKAVDTSKLSSQQYKADRQRFRDKLRAYVREMGIDPTLVDVSEAVPHEKVQYLTRNQVAKFGIDRSTFSETPWKFVEGPSLSPAMSKFFFEVRGEEKPEFPASYIRVACSTNSIGKAAVFYSRGLTSGETNKQQIKLLVGEEGLQVKSTGVRQYDWIESERSFDVRFAVADFSRLRVSGDVLEIVETSWAEPAPFAHIVRLSAKGWGEALGRLREKCLNPGGVSDRGTRG